MRHVYWFCKYWLSLLAVTGISSAGFTQGYTITDLGAIGYYSGNPYHLTSNAYGINNSGTITDSSQYTDFSGTAVGVRAFSYANGNMTDLGTLGGDNSFGYAINDSGTVIGMSYTWVMLNMLSRPPMAL